GHPCPGFAARLTPEDTDGLRQAPGTLCVPGGKRRQTFGKGPTGTCGGETAETPDVQAEAYGMLSDGEVPQAARVAAVDARGGGVTIWAYGFRRTGMGVDEKHRRGRDDVFHHKARQRKGQ